MQLERGEYPHSVKDSNMNSRRVWCKRINGGESLEGTAGKTCTQESTNIRILINHKRQKCYSKCLQITQERRKSICLTWVGVCICMDLFMNGRARVWDEFGKHFLVHSSSLLWQTRYFTFMKLHCAVAVPSECCLRISLFLLETFLYSLS